MRRVVVCCVRLLSFPDRAVQLYNNALETLSGIDALVQLTELRLTDNLLESLDGLGNLTKLAVLKVG